MALAQARAPLPIPATPADLSAAWLTAALRRWGGREDVTVTDLTVTPLVESRGFFGQLMRVRVTYAAECATEYADAAPDAPRALIAKFSSPMLEMRRRSVDSYRREVNFYRTLAPHLDLPVPRCYYAEINEESGDHLILLEELTALRGGVRVAGCTVAQAALALAEITKLHIAWWERTDDPALEWLPDNDIAPDAATMLHQYEQWWPEFYAQAGAHIPEAMVAHSAALGQQRAAIRHHIFGSGPRTLIHRDFQLDNLLFDELEHGSPAGNGFAIVDWQFLSRGRGVWDVAYFLSESLLPEVRRAVEMDALVRYHAALVAGGVAAYSFEQCLMDYRVALLQRHTALVSTLAAMPFSDEQRRIHRDVLLPRNIAALLDHNAFALFS